MFKSIMARAIVVFVVSVLSTSICQGQDSFDFRHSHWGDSKEDVKNTESDKKIIHEESDILVVSDILNGLDCEVVYLFIDNKLIRSKYMIKEKYSNGDMYVVKYNELVDLLSKKYGKGKDKNIIADLYKRPGADLGVGVGVGKVHFVSEWKNSKSAIHSVLTGNNFNITLTIEYASIEFAPLEAAKKQKKTLEKL